MNKEELEAKGKEITEFLSTKDINFICYIWDKEGKLGSLNLSPNATLGDAASAIRRIIKVFGINREKLFALLAKDEKADGIKEIERMVDGDEGKKP